MATPSDYFSQRCHCSSSASVKAGLFYQIPSCLSCQIWCQRSVGWRRVSSYPWYCWQLRLSSASQYWDSWCFFAAVSVPYLTLATNHSLEWLHLVARWSHSCLYHASGSSCAPSCHRWTVRTALYSKCWYFSPSPCSIFFCTSANCFAVYVKAHSHAYSSKRPQSRRQELQWASLSLYFLNWGKSFDPWNHSRPPLGYSEGDSHLYWSTGWLPISDRSNR